MSVSFELPSSVAALIVGMQPLLTAVGAALFLNERLTRTQWFGQALGILGVALVVERKMSLDINGIAGVLACLVALAAMTIGTLWQKRFCTAMDLRSDSAIQFAAAAALTGLASLVVETHRIAWTTDLFIALGSLIFVSSLGATTLLYILIRRGAASRVSSLFYLVPIVAAILEYLIFREEFGPITVLGMALASTGVMMITMAPRPGLARAGCHTCPVTARGAASGCRCTTPVGGDLFPVDLVGLSIGGEWLLEVEGVGARSVVVQMFQTPAARLVGRAFGIRPPHHIGRPPVGLDEPAFLAVFLQRLAMKAVIGERHQRFDVFPHEQGLRNRAIQFFVGAGIKARMRHRAARGLLWRKAGC